MQRKQITAEPEPYIIRDSGHFNNQSNNPNNQMRNIQITSAQVKSVLIGTVCKTMQPNRKQRRFMDFKFNHVQNPHSRTQNYWDKNRCTQLIPINPNEGYSVSINGKRTIKFKTIVHAVPVDQRNVLIPINYALNIMTY